MKIVVKKRNKGANVPPYSYVTTVDDAAVRSESDLIKQVYTDHGSGRYAMFVNPGSKFRAVWDGYIRPRGDDEIVFHADNTNQLHVYTDVLRQTTPDSAPQTATAPDRDPSAGVAQ